MNSKVADIVTAKIIDKLDSGVIPWRKPWSNIWQSSYINKRAYTGINQLILQFEAQDMGYNSPYWLTFNQASKLGYIRKGSKSVPIIFFGIGEDDTETDKDGKPRTYRFLRYYRVFNASVVEGLELPPVEEKEHPQANNISHNYLLKNSIELHHRGNRAYYSPVNDSITLPLQEQFKTLAGYYSTLFHEMTHSTGHESRLDRFQKGSFGDSDYSKEELIAEIGACMLCHIVGIEPELDNTASYIKGWLKALKNDRTLLISASSKANKAIELIIK